MWFWFIGSFSWAGGVSCRLDSRVGNSGDGNGDIRVRTEGQGQNGALLSLRTYFHPKHTQISRFSLLINLPLTSHVVLLPWKDELSSCSPAVLLVLCIPLLCPDGQCCSWMVTSHGWDGDFSPGKGTPLLESSYRQGPGITETWDYQMKWSLCFKATNSGCKQLKPQSSDASKSPCIYQSHFKLLSEPKDLIAV